MSLLSYTREYVHLRLLRRHAVTMSIAPPRRVTTRYRCHTEHHHTTPTIVLPAAQCLRVTRLLYERLSVMFIR